MRASSSPVAPLTWPQPRARHVVAADDVRRQVTTVASVEETPLLVAVQRVVGAVEEISFGGEEGAMSSFQALHEVRAGCISRKGPAPPPACGRPRRSGRRGPGSRFPTARSAPDPRNERTAPCRSSGGAAGSRPAVIAGAPPPFPDLPTKRRERLRRAASSRGGRTCSNRRSSPRSDDTGERSSAPTAAPCPSRGRF